MPEVVLQEPNRRFNETRKDSVAYGDKDLLDTFPSEQPYHSAWTGRIPLPQQFPTIIYFWGRPSVNPEGREVSISGWSEKEDPFTQTDLLENEENLVKKLILQIRTSLSIPYRERLINRLLTLFNDAKEEDSTSLGISIGSLRNFYNFLRLHPNLKYPRISLSPDCNIYVSWRINQNHVFSIYFLSEKDAVFVVLKPNEAHPDRQIRVSGTITTDILMEKVAPYGVWDWISE
ncbi:MAG: hypothetical protein A2Z47_06640 [Thermodesulfovibrio sp. RBG_19FT_COMBO_42_12]|nr:MAG: hypothetical protein A2Z47_06640 [Thermodesulfovibrio sp. RBG_19FT_COMBO_42_12]